MVDRAEVISQLERCTLQTDLPIRTHRDACAICHYKRDGRCNFTSLMADALALLKEQEPKHGRWKRLTGMAPAETHGIANHTAVQEAGYIVYAYLSKKPSNSGDGYEPPEGACAI